MIRPLLLVAAIVLAATASAQDRYTPIAPMPVGDRILTLPTSHIPAAGTWEVLFAHRFNQSIDEGDAWHSLLGLDSNANVTLGGSYTPIRDFQISLVRSNILDTFELAGKYVAIQQSPAVPLSAAFRAGGDFRTEENIEDRTSVFAQALLSHQFGQRLVVFVEPSYITNAGRTAIGGKDEALFDSAFNVPVGASLQMTPHLSFVAELVPSNTDLPGAFSADLGWAAGIKSVIGGHYFEILLSNSNGTTLDQYLSSTFQGAPFNGGDIQLGFNIERRWGKPR